MAYNLTAVDATNTTYQFIVEMNKITSPQYLMITTILYALWIILFAATYGATRNTKTSLFFSSISTSVIGVFLIFSELILWEVVSIPIIATIVSLIIIFTIKE